LIAGLGIASLLAGPILHRLIGRGVGCLYFQCRMGLHPLGYLSLENVILFLETVEFIQAVVEIHDDEDDQQDPNEHRNTTQIDGKLFHPVILP